MADNFFAQQEEQQEQEVEKIRLGNEEYTQEELSKLVGLGKIGLEAEQKYHTKLDKVWPQFQQTVNEKKALEDRIRLEEETRQRVLAERQQPQQQQPGQQMTQEQMRAEALKNAEALGIGPQAIRQTVMEIIQGQQLLQDINNTIDSMVAEGLPETTPEDIIKHMQETGIRNPEKAYKDMYEQEWVTKQAEKLDQIRNKGIPTIASSTAGAKQPAPVRVTQDNFDELFAAALTANAS